MTHRSRSGGSARFSRLRVCSRRELRQPSSPPLKRWLWRQGLASALSRSKKDKRQLQSQAITKLLPPRWNDAAVSCFCRRCVTCRLFCGPPVGAPSFVGSATNTGARPLQSLAAWLSSSPPKGVARGLPQGASVPGDLLQPQAAGLAQAAAHSEDPVALLVHSLHAFRQARPCICCDSFQQVINFVLFQSTYVPGFLRFMNYIELG